MKIFFVSNGMDYEDHSMIGAIVAPDESHRDKIKTIIQTTTQTFNQLYREHCRIERNNVRSFMPPDWTWDKFYKDRPKPDLDLMIKTQLTAAGYEYIEIEEDFSFEDSSSEIYFEVKHENDGMMRTGRNKE